MQLFSRRCKPTAFALTNPQKQHTLKVHFQAEARPHRGSYSDNKPAETHLRSAGSVAPSPSQQQHDTFTGADVSDSRGTTSSNTSSSNTRSSSSSSSNSSSCDCAWGIDDDVASCSSPAAAMVSFLSAYGLQPADIQRLTQECPELFCGDSSSSSGVQGSCTAGWSPYSYEEEAAAQEAAAAAAAGSCSCSDSTSSSSSSSSSSGGGGSSSSVYEVGRTLLFFHSLGWSHSSVLRRIVGLYPQLLTKQVDRDIRPVLSSLSAMGCSQSDLQLLVWEFPRIFTSSNWRRHVRKFQYLGLYGLPPPGPQRNRTSSSSSSGGGGGGGGDGGTGGTDSGTDSSGDSLDRLMRWL